MIEHNIREEDNLKTSDNEPKKHPDKIFSSFVLFKLKPFWELTPNQFFEATLGIKICYKLFKNNLEQRNNQLIVIVQGRGESMFKYAETCFHFYHLGFDVLLYDHRGQGLSERLLKDTQKGYVEKFGYYAADLDLLLNHLKIKNYKNRFLISHSLGGLVAQNYLANYPHIFDKCCFISPFFGLDFKLNKVIYAMVKILDFIGLGKVYVFGRGEYTKSELKNNIHNSNQSNIKWENKIHRLNPNIKMGGPTFHWLNEALLEFDQLEQNLSKIKTPCLVILAENEQVVSYPKQLSYSQKINNVKIEIIHKAHHEILSEHSHIKYKALNLMLSFFEHKYGELGSEDSMADYS